MHEQAYSDLKEIIFLLNNDGQKHWSIFFKKALTNLERGNYLRCAEIILSGIGGMGSLNDLVLGQIHNSTDEFEWKSDYKKTNEQYLQLLDSLYEYAHNVRQPTSR